MKTSLKDDLRKAMTSLNIRKPLKLPATHPSFRAPTVPQFEAPQIEHPQNEVPQNEHPRIEVPQIEGAGLDRCSTTKVEPVPIPASLNIMGVSLQFEVPQVEGPQNEVAQTEHPQIEGAQNEGADRGQPYQNQVPQLEGPQNEVPQNEVARNRAAGRGLHDLPQFEGAGGAVTEPAVNGTSGGYFPLAHSVFQSDRLKDLSGDAFRIALWLGCQAWRFQNSKGQVRASVGFIAKMTRVSEATVSRALKQLKAAGVIRCERVDFQLGNVWSVLPIFRGPGSPPESSPSSDSRKHPQIEVPQIESAQNEVAPPSNRGTTSLKMRKQHPQIEGDTKDLKIQKNKRTLSARATELQRYLSSEMPVRKRASEERALEGLLRQYGEERVEAAFRFLSASPKYRALGVHSPMAFLAKAIAGVLREVDASTEARVKAERAAATRVEGEKGACLAEERAEREFAVACEALERRFPAPEGREEALRPFLGVLPWLSPAGALARRMAVLGWWESEEKGLSDHAVEPKLALVC